MGRCMPKGLCAVVVLCEGGQCSGEEGAPSTAQRSATPRSRARAALGVTHSPPTPDVGGECRRWHGPSSLRELVTGAGPSGGSDALGGGLRADAYACVFAASQGGDAPRSACSARQRHNPALASHLALRSHRFHHQRWGDAGRDRAAHTNYFPLVRLVSHKLQQEGSHGHCEKLTVTRRSPWGVWVLGDDGVLNLDLPMSVWKWLGDGVVHLKVKWVVDGATIRLHRQSLQAHDVIAHL